MLTPDMLTTAGRFNKTHGVKGEISATFDLDLDPETLRCLFVDMDGIPVPFFIASCRPKSAETWLLTFEGIDSAEKASEFVNKTFSVLDTDLPEEAGLDPGADGFYASDFIGFKMIDSALGEIGEIVDVNDLTENVLFIVERPDGNELLIPVADEFIDSIDVSDKKIHTTIPEEIVNLNS
ncbi:MAG: ribosome maturation factor RimM [Muribaculaceae bacterium]|nr:ribosome maturation factor RimM [Muribaculaceae bacterium]